MRSPILLLLACMAAMAAFATPVQAQGGGGQAPPSGQQAPPPPEPPAQPPPELVVQKPHKGALFYEGQTERYLLDGTWYFRPDDAFVGERERWFDQDDLIGWTAIDVPHNWNATDTLENKPNVGWYRKEFELPQMPKGKRYAWKVRFEGANYRTNLWLNGKKIGDNTGYFPWEALLDNLRRGRNTLVAKVSTLRGNTDLTHWRPAAFNGHGTGGWWNFGGLLREVYLRPVDTVDVESVRALSHLKCVKCPAKVDVYATVNNPGKEDRQVSIAVNVGDLRAQSQPREVVKGTSRVFHTSVTIPRPRLWQPGRPNLYNVSVAAGTEGVRRSTYRLKLGVRKLETGKGGVILLNGRRVALRGASIHEDDKETGGALTPRTRANLVGRLRNLGATITRSHYPLHPQFLEAFDRAGILYWVDAPVYQLPNSFFDQPSVRNAAMYAVERTVRYNVNHASVMTWSLTNEPGGGRSELGVIGDGLAQYLKDASARARELDDTRFISFERQSRLGEPLTHPAFRYLDVLGVNEYFGWYDSTSPEAQQAATASSDLSSYLDQLHAANPNLPLVITEFGAEAKTWGPVEQPGTYEFQQKFAADHLAIHASKPFVNGSIWWALRDFRVHPQWVGGAPPEWATPPWHNKSLIEEDGTPKPVYSDMRKAWRATKPLR